jgi:diamine N-acetyltransferase
MTESQGADVRFHLAGPADTEALVEMMREFYAHERLAWDEARVHRALGELLGDSRNGRAWIVRKDGADAGYFFVTLGFSLEFGGRDAFLDELYLREAHRGGGLGQRAIEHMARACAEMGVRALHLEVDHDNEGAQRFYRRLGFYAHDRFLMTRWMDETRRE